MLHSPVEQHQGKKDAHSQRDREMEICAQYSMDKYNMPQVQWWMIIAGLTKTNVVVSYFSNMKYFMDSKVQTDTQYTLYLLSFSFVTAITASHNVEVRHSIVSSKVV